MSAQHCQQCKECRDLPTQQEWEANRGIIVDGYNIWKLGRLQEYMHSSHNFHASQRQFKTKLRAWKVPPKRIGRGYYLAMKRIIDERPDLSQSIIFKDPRGREITPQKIVKEIGRHKQPEPVPSITFDEATAILRQAGHTWVFREQQSYSSLPTHNGPTFSDSDGDSSDGPSTPHNLDDASMSNEEQSFFLPIEPHPYYSRVNFIDEFDCWEIGDNFARRCLQSPTDLEQGGRDTCLPPPKRSSVNYPKNWVLQWADPWLRDSTPHSSLDLDKGKQEGLAKLEFLIKTDPSNPYIFPAMIQMMVVLVSNDYRANLEDFVAQSCQAFDIVVSRPNAAKQEIQGISLRPMFMYIKAATQKKVEMETEYGKLLPGTAAFFADHLGEDHPHVHSANLFYAWHLMKRDEYAQVLELLESCLRDAATSEVSWKFYKYNILAISGKAFAALGDHVTACDRFERAVWSLDHWPVLPPHLKPLSWDTALEWAKSQAQLGNCDAAMAAFEEVIKRRSIRFSHKHGKTWDAILMYRDQLIAWGRHNDAQTLEDCHERQYGKEWYEEQGLVKAECELPPGLRDISIPTFAAVDTRHILTPTAQGLVERAFAIPLS